MAAIAPPLLSHTLAWSPGASSGRQVQPQPATTETHTTCLTSGLKVDHNTKYTVTAYPSGSPSAFQQQG
ncbi:hypothetical protein SETIT_9G261600v2 [Setaria italica]|uniref:Uncharacterized protein n=1 Tax=Setaria italica TaxID=4555 RepID=A0A368SKP1_SETIT|nr:hypothetical protein SETIT_9G261600v2 [Setaria italica]RCV43010.1 hypothetical protein SETIT_9G261600v2 [Setaria italica]